MEASSAIDRDLNPLPPVPRRWRRDALWVQFLLFCCVGSVNTGVDAGMFALLVWLLNWRDGFEPTFASVLGFAAGAANSYLLNSRVTFGARCKAPQRLEFGRFTIVTASGMLVSGATFALVRHLWPEPSGTLLAAKTVALAVGTATNFTLQRAWVFRSGAIRGGKTRRSSGPH